MFDRHYHSRGPETVNVNMTEQRAPTDESVRLLSEMEKAARDKITSAVRLEDSPIDCVIHVQQNAMNYDHDVCVFVSINGKRLEVRKSFRMDTSTNDIGQSLLEAVSRRIAAEVLAAPFARMVGKLPLI